MNEKKEKILLGMLASNGDCLMATVLARQIKKDFPGCHLTWAVSNRCKQMVLGNPDVDAIWEINVSSVQDALQEGWRHFKTEVTRRVGLGDFDNVYLVQIYPDNVANFDGTTRGTIYNAYPFPVTVDARPVIRLTGDETRRVKQFAGTHQLEKYQQVILFECSSLSGQSFVDPVWAVDLARRLVQQLDDIIIVLSTHQEVGGLPGRVISGHSLSLRENAELTRYCHLLVGCSSGISWIATTDWAKRIPVIQFIKRGTGFTFASMAYDHRYWKLDDSQIIETTNNDPARAAALVSLLLTQGVAIAKAKYHQALRPKFISLLKYAFLFFRKGKWRSSMKVMRQFIRRNYLRNKN